MFKCLSFKSRKTNHFRITALLLITSMATILCSPATANDDFQCGDGGGGSADIFAWAAEIDADQNLVVDVILCDSVDEKIKYRLHIDHSALFFDEVDDCSTTSDDTMKLHRGRTTGPSGTIEILDIDIFGEDTWLQFTVNMADLSPDIVADDMLYVWLDTQNKGIADRAPDTDGSDGCSKPEVGGEALPLVVPCDGLVTLNNDGTEYNAAEGSFTPPLGGGVTGDLAWIGLGGVPDSELGCDTSPADFVLDPLAVPYGESVAGKIALIKRGTCFFETKVKLAEDAGAIAVVVFNNAGDDVIIMGSSGFFPVTIPAVFIGQSDGVALAARREAGLDTNVTLQCTNSSP